MKKIAFVVAAAGLMALAACKPATPPASNADAEIANIQATADNLNDEAAATTNNVAAAEIGNATKSLDNATDAIRAEAGAANTAAPAKK